MAQMNTDFSSGPLDYSSAELKRNLNGYHLAHGYYFIAHGSQIFSSGPFIFWTRIARIKRIFFLRTIGLFHPHGKSRTIGLIHPHGKIRCLSVCKKIFVKFVRFVFKTHHPHGKFVFKEESVFICVYPCAKNIRFVLKEKSVFICAICGRIKIIIRG